MPDNPEQAVIDQIDALVNESLAHGPTDDYERDYQERCDICMGEWHGLPSPYDACPGAYATPEQHAEYLQSHRRNRGHIPIWPRYTYTEWFASNTGITNRGAHSTHELLDEAHIAQDRPTSPNIETQSGTMHYRDDVQHRTSWTLTDIARMRERAWLTRTYDGTPTFDHYDELLMCYTRTHNTRCTQCQRHMTNTTNPLCDECTHMRTTAHARALETLDNQVRALINRQLTHDAMQTLNINTPHT